MKYDVSPGNSLPYRNIWLIDKQVFRHAPAEIVSFARATRPAEIFSKTKRLDPKVQPIRLNKSLDEFQSGLAFDRIR